MAVVAIYGPLGRFQEPVLSCSLHIFGVSSLSHTKHFPDRVVCQYPLKPESRKQQHWTQKKNVRDGKHRQQQPCSAIREEGMGPKT
jgi:hypothetical protein